MCTFPLFLSHNKGEIKNRSSIQVNSNLMKTVELSTFQEKINLD